MGIKQTRMPQVAFQNIGSFSQDEAMNLKFEVMHRFVTDCNIDIFGFTEMNTCWDLLSEQNQPARWTQGWWETSQWSISYNHTEPKDVNNTPYQPRDTGILCVNQVMHWTMKLGNDPLGLGWWCWTCIWEPAGFVLQIVMMYRPCYSTRPLMTYQQHVYCLTKLGCFACPRELTLSNLVKEIQQWQEDGDQVVVLTDCNDNVSLASIRQ